MRVTVPGRAIRCHEDGIDADVEIEVAGADDVHALVLGSGGTRSAITISASELRCSRTLEHEGGQLAPSSARSHGRRLLDLPGGGVREIDF